MPRIHFQVSRTPCFGCESIQDVIHCNEGRGPWGLTLLALTDSSRQTSIPDMADADPTLAELPGKNQGYQSRKVSTEGSLDAVVS